VPPETVFDQASGLRRLLGAGGGARVIGVFGVDARLNALAGANLACAMTHRGAQVMICDEAAAPDNVATMVGLSPAHGLAQVLAGQRAVAEALADNGAGLRLLNCAVPPVALALAPPESWARVAPASADADWLFAVSPGDGRGSLALAAPERILVAPAGKNHLTEAYALMKTVHRLQPEGRWWILLMDLNDAERGTLMMQAITETSRRFLEVEPGFLGGVPRDAKLDLSARAMRPVLDYAPGSAAATTLRGAAETLARATPHGVDPDTNEFWPRAGLIARNLAAHPSASGNAHGRRYG
jgi:flagellar biosynthesis protein FlhG